MSLRYTVVHPPPRPFGQPTPPRRKRLRRPAKLATLVVPPRTEPPSMPAAAKQLSFCVTTMARDAQIRQTLPRNLRDNWAHRDTVEFVVVDFNGPTSALRPWVEREFARELDAGLLRYYVSDALQHWHASIAKNTAHRLAVGEILVNLDNDNFTGPSAATYILSHMRSGQLLHLFDGRVGRGSGGRIAYWAKDFFAIGGYDETFLPMGYQDADIMRRLRASGVRARVLRQAPFPAPLVNSKTQSIQRCAPGTKRMGWAAMNQRNRATSDKNVRQGRLRANARGQSIGVAVIERPESPRE